MHNQLQLLAISSAKLCLPVLDSNGGEQQPLKVNSCHIHKYFVGTVLLYFKPYVIRHMSPKTDICSLYSLQQMPMLIVILVNRWYGLSMGVILFFCLCKSQDHCKGGLNIHTPEGCTELRHLR